MIDDGMWRVRYKNSTDTNKKIRDLTRKCDARINIE